MEQIVQELNQLNLNQWTGTIQVENLGTTTWITLHLPTIHVDIDDIAQLQDELTSRSCLTPTVAQVLELIESAVYEIKYTWEEDFVWFITKTRAFEHTVDELITQWEQQQDTANV